MTLALHPTNGMVYIWGPRPGQIRSRWPVGPSNAVERKTCSVCKYELLDGWCSRCDLEENGVLV